MPKKKVLSSDTVYQTLCELKKNREGLGLLTSDDVKPQLTRSPLSQAAVMDFNDISSNSEQHNYFQCYFSG
jgi:hypothetical protein